MWWRYIIFRPFFAIVGNSKKYNLKVSGVENVPRYGPFIVVSNHQSSLDIVAIALALKPALIHSHMWPWAKTDIEKGREGPLGWALWRVFGVIPIDREKKDHSEAILLSLKYLRRRELVFVFPEGTRSKAKELRPFQFGVANLARAAPAPILPVAVYRRDEDGGIQVNIGMPFTLPPKKKMLEVLGDLQEKAEGRFIQQVETLRQWADTVPHDKKGMKLISRMVRIVTDFVSRKDISFDLFFRLAEEEDNEYIRDRICELLPSDWKKVDTAGKPGPLSIVKKEQ
ncbi:MAG: lysophospholipid acyltransferase family protein [Actinomycetota bacterium]|nr:lysophospholipid acyltransferase family protein [Actinomycetota bacterium]MDD5666546.1 lysophospholipid acyltransferase family protein [Actinomycetota bacterium]